MSERPPTRGGIRGPPSAAGSFVLPQKPLCKAAHRGGQLTGCHRVQRHSLLRVKWFTGDSGLHNSNRPRAGPSVTNPMSESKVQGSPMHRARPSMQSPIQGGKTKARAQPHERHFGLSEPAPQPKGSACAQIPYESPSSSGWVAVRTRFCTGVFAHDRSAGVTSPYRAAKEAGDEASPSW
jgi:hypothetical protein